MKFKVNDLPMSARLRLTQALRDSVKDDKRLSADELVAKVAPLLDEYKIPAEHSAALINDIVLKFDDGSVVDPEAQKILAVASASFELGNDPGRELKKLIRAVRHDAQGSGGKEATKQHLLAGIAEITSRPALLERLKKQGGVSVELPRGLEPTVFESSMYSEPLRATRAFLTFDESYQSKVSLNLGVPWKGDFHRYSADFYPIESGLGMLLERSPVEAGAAFAESLLEALSASVKTAER